MKVSNFSSWIILAAAASTTAFAPRTVLSGATSTSISNNTCSSANKDGKSCASAALSSRGGASSLSMSTTTDGDVDTKKPTEIFRLDYKPLDLIVSKINMDFNIRDGKTIVESEMFVEKNPKLENDWDPNAIHDLVLDGDETSITLLEVTLDGKVLIEGDDYTLDSTKLIIKNPPSGSLLRTKVSIVPEDNTQLSGLYQSSGPMYCTQCEAMGFRRITYYPDRPDNVSLLGTIDIHRSGVCHYGNYSLCLCLLPFLKERSLDRIAFAVMFCFFYIRFHSFILL
jgi:hypothetical protein